MRKDTNGSVLSDSDRLGDRLYQLLANSLPYAGVEGPEEETIFVPEPKPFIVPEPAKEPASPQPGRTQPTPEVVPAGKPERS